MGNTLQKIRKLSWLETDCFLYAECYAEEMKVKIVYSGGQGELVEKKSRFIATVEPVESEEEALEFIARMKKKYWDATHNCWAFVVGDHQELQRCSDDGEPQGTAGRPMLDLSLIHICGVHQIKGRIRGFSDISF